MAENNHRIKDFQSLLADTYNEHISGHAPGSVLRRLRKERHASLSSIARQAGFNKGSLSRIETGENNPTLETLIELFDALGLQLGSDPLPHAIIMGFAQKYKVENKVAKLHKRGSKRRT